MNALDIVRRRGDPRPRDDLPSDLDDHYLMLDTRAGRESLRFLLSFPTIFFLILSVIGGALVALIASVSSDGRTWWVTSGIGSAALFFAISVRYFSGVGLAHLHRMRIVVDDTHLFIRSWRFRIGGGWKPLHDWTRLLLNDIDEIFCSETMMFIEARSPEASYRFGIGAIVVDARGFSPEPSLRELRMLIYKMAISSESLSPLRQRRFEAAYRGRVMPQIGYDEPRISPEELASWIRTRFATDLVKDRPGRLYLRKSVGVVAKIRIREHNELTKIEFETPIRLLTAVLSALAVVVLVFTYVLFSALRSRIVVFDFFTIGLMVLPLLVFALPMLLFVRGLGRYIGEILLDIVMELRQSRLRLN